MTVTGGAEFAAQMRALSPRTERGLLSKMLVKAAEPMRQRMEDLAPQAPGAPDIKANILAKPTNAKTLGQTDAYGMRDREETESVVVVGPAKGFFYGFFLEYGTEKMTAQPFMRPAFDEKAPQAVSIFSAEMWSWMKSKIVRTVSPTGRNL